MKAPELLWICNFSESYYEERISIYVSVKQNRYWAQREIKGAVWLLKLFKAAILLWPFRWIRHELGGRVYFGTSDIFNFCIGEGICAVTLLIKMAVRKNEYHNRGHTGNFCLNLQLVSASCVIMAIIRRNTKKSMCYSCKPRTEAALCLSQAFWKSKVLKSIINLGWVAWLAPLLYPLMRNLPKWNKGRTPVHVNENFFSLFSSQGINNT